MKFVVGESGLVGKVPELSILKKTVLNVNSFGLNGNWYGPGEIMEICVVRVRLLSHFLVNYS